MKWRRSWGPEDKAETLKEIFRAGSPWGSFLRNCYRPLPIALASGSKVGVHAPFFAVIPAHLAAQAPALQAAASLGSLGLEQGRAGAILGHGTAGQGTHLQLDRPGRPAAQLAAAQGPAPRLQKPREDQLPGRAAPLQLGPLETQAQQTWELLIEPNPPAAPPLSPQGSLSFRKAFGCGTSRRSPLQATAPQRPFPAAHPLQAPLGPPFRVPIAEQCPTVLALDGATPLAARAGRCRTQPQPQPQSQRQPHGQAAGRSQ